jgi:hypothetical protein
VVIGMMMNAKNSGSRETEENETHDATHEQYIIQIAEFLKQCPCSKHKKNERALPKAKP